MLPWLAEVGLLAVNIDQDVLQQFFTSGKWNERADAETTQYEQLDLGLAKQLILDYRASPTDRHNIGQLGLLVLAVSVAEWGAIPSPAD